MRMRDVLIEALWLTPIVYVGVHAYGVWGALIGGYAAAYGCWSLRKGFKEGSTA